MGKFRAIGEGKVKFRGPHRTKKQAWDNMVIWEGKGCTKDGKCVEASVTMAEAEKMLACGCERCLAFFSEFAEAYFANKAVRDGLPAEKAPAVFEAAANSEPKQ